MPPRLATRSMTSLGEPQRRLQVLYILSHIWKKQPQGKLWQLRASGSSPPFMYFCDAA
jgi:hypothetical protein